MVGDLLLHVGAVEVGAAGLLELVERVAVRPIQLRGRRELARGGQLHQLAVGLGVVLHHLLRERAHLRALRLLGGELPGLHLGHPAHRGFHHELPVRCGQIGSGIGF
jgi:hypothetical protein